MCVDSLSPQSDRDSVVAELAASVKAREELAAEYEEFKAQTQEAWVEHQETLTKLQDEYETLVKAQSVSGKQPVNICNNYVSNLCVCLQEREDTYENNVNEEQLQMATKALHMEVEAARAREVRPTSQHFFLHY